MMNTRVLMPGDLSQMLRAFNLAFREYPIPMQQTLPQFEIRILKKLQMDFSYSPSVWEDDQLIAFIFHKIEKYQEVRTAYNGGTGVLPDHRRQGLVQKMFDFIVPRLKNDKVEQLVLEVLVNNKKAIKSYQAAEFEINRKLLCFKAEKIANTSTPDIHIKKVESPDWKLYQSWASTVPAFGDSFEMLIKSDAEIVWQVEHNSKAIGYLSFQPENGRISQISINPAWRGQGIGQHLLFRLKRQFNLPHLTVLNVSEDAEEILSFLKKLGFRNEINQWEMIRKI